MRAAGTVIPAIAAITGDHPPGDKCDGEKGEEDFEGPERGLGCPGGQKGDAGAYAHDPSYQGLYLEPAVGLPLVDLMADHRGIVTISSIWAAATSPQPAANRTTSPTALTAAAPGGKKAETQGSR
jgi:hypothetical protein